MDFDRHDRVRAQLKEFAALFIRNEANTDPLITVTDTSISPDYKRATIRFTTIPDDRQEDALIFLKRSAGNFRDFLKKKSAFKRIPHIEFEVDYGERHRQHIDEIARDIENK